MRSFRFWSLAVTLWLALPARADVWPANGTRREVAVNLPDALGNPADPAQFPAQPGMVALTAVRDTNPPGVLAVTRPVDDGSLSVLFSKPVESATACAATNYTIDNRASVISAVLSVDAQTVILATSPLRPGLTYTLTVNNVRDRAVIPNLVPANSRKSFQVGFTPLDISRLTGVPETMGPCSRRTPLVISEIMFHPPARLDGANPEFIEIYNSQEWAEELGGFRLTGAVEFTFPDNLLIPARSYLLLAARPADVQTAYGATAPYAYTNSLPRGGGTIRLRNRQNAVLLEVRFGGQAPCPPAADGAGHSLVLKRPSLGERNRDAWGASDRIGGSPGSAESSLDNAYRTVLINEILARPVPSSTDYVELYNYGTNAVDLGGCILTDDPLVDKFKIPPGITIPAQGWLKWGAEALGFGLKGAGDTVYFKDPNQLKVLDAIRFGPQATGVPWGRYPDGNPQLQSLANPTPGGPNERPALAEVVLNEIMHSPAGGDSALQFVELFNRGSNSVSLAGWEISGGISWRFPGGAVIDGGGYVVVAADANRLQAVYPRLPPRNVFGNFSGRLAGGGEALVLTRPEKLAATNTDHQIISTEWQIPVDRVDYQAGGRWGAWNGGGGSSLELIDPLASHALAPSWADSDETAKSPWVTLETTGRLDNGQANADGLQVFLMGAGEMLVDEVEVIPLNSTNLMSNGNFEKGLTGWTPQGNQYLSHLETTGGYLNSPCLHLVATGRGDTGANRVRTRLIRTLPEGATAMIRARVRWLKGFPEILFRFHGGQLELLGSALATQALGTPGAPNSRAGNAGPAIVEVDHQPLLPKAGQAVWVKARVEDPDHVARLVLKYRLDPSTNLVVVAMTNNGAGYFSAQLPAQASGLAAWHLEAQDAAEHPAITRFPASAPDQECLVRWADPSTPTRFGTYRVWLTKKTVDRWTAREKLSNDPLDCTFAYGGQRAIYNAGAMYAGSPWHAPGYNSPLGNYCDYVLVFSGDDTLLNDEEISLLLPGNGCCDSTLQTEQTAYWLANQLGLPFTYRRPVSVFFNGQRRAPALMDDSQQPNGDFLKQWYPGAADADLHKIQVWFEFDDTLANFNAVGCSFGNWTTTGGARKLARYRWNWGARAFGRTANNYTNLLALQEAATTTATGETYLRQIRNLVDVDEWARTLAVEHIVGNTDSWGYGGGQNMYTTKPAGESWKLLIWDIDFAFVAASTTDPLFSFGDTYLQKIYNQPVFLRAYYRALMEAARGPLLTNRAGALLDRKYQAFSATGLGAAKPDSIKSYINARRNYIEQQLARVNQPFRIASGGLTNLSVSGNLLSLSGTAPVEVERILINGVEYSANWTSLTNFNLQLALQPGANALAVQGLNHQGQVLTQAMAGLQIVCTALDEPAPVIFSEIMYHPARPETSFVELFSTAQTNAIDLAGWQVQGLDFTFSQGAVLPPGGFLVLAGNRAGFASAYGSNLPVAGEFKGSLDASGETLSLVMPGARPEKERVVNRVTYRNSPPWPAAADGTGASLQLIDARQDNRRPGNWAAVSTNASWRYATASGIAGYSRIYLYLMAGGDAYVDDLKLVAGNVPEKGSNLLTNSDFEGAFPGPWKLAGTHAQSEISSKRTHGGARALHLVASAPGGTASSVYEDLSPTLPTGQPYTVSFWWCPGTNDNTLVVRTHGNWAATNCAFSGVPLNPPARFTPGAANSMRSVLPDFQPIWLNEVHPASVATAGTAWVELFNPSSSPVSLSSLYLSGSSTNLLEWPFPINSTLGPHEFLVVGLDGGTNPVPGARFRAPIPAPLTNGWLALSQANGPAAIVLDALAWPSLHSGWSYGSYPDGQPDFRGIMAAPTPGAANQPASPPVHLFINEWMADNRRTMVNPANGQNDDWFEIFNPGNQAASLDGLYLTDDLGTPLKFPIPAGYSVPPGGFLLAWADGEPRFNQISQPDLHVNFKLDAAGEGIGLFAKNGQPVDTVVFSSQWPDVSQGRFPDGSPAIYLMTNTTPQAPNLPPFKNTPPMLKPVGDQVLAPGQILSLTISATDTDLPPQQLHFVLGPEAPAGATVDGNTGGFSWAPGLGQVGMHAVQLAVTDSGTPPLSNSLTFRVWVALPPDFSGFALHGNSLELAWQVTPGLKYQVQCTADCVTGPWLPLGDPLVAAGDSLRFAVALAAPHWFYRLVLWRE